MAKKEKGKQLDLTVVISSFAPQVTGSTILIDNLLSEFEGSVEAISTWSLDSKSDDSWLPVCKVHRLNIKNKWINKIIRRFRFRLSFIYYQYIRRKLKQNRPKAVLGVFPKDVFAVSAYKACKDLNIPFLLHMHDLWEENMTGKAREYAAKWEPILIKNADIVYCMTSSQQKFYEEKYGVTTDLLIHTASKELLEKKVVKKALPNDEKLVLYTGNVSNSMSLDAMQQFVKAVDDLPKNYKIICLTNPDKETLIKRKIYNPRIEYKWVSRAEAQEYQNSATILFMPLSHKNCSIDEVNTVFTTKTLEYLVSRTPILTFAPSTSFHSIDSKKGNWSYVVNEDNPKAITEAIVKLCNDKVLQNTLVDNALIEASKRSNVEYAKKLLLDINRTSENAQDN